MDCLSSLPDDLLAHILSFLPTKQAALTSALSKRWRNLHALVPNLDIDNSVFLHPEEGKGKRHEIMQSFMDFVDRVLALQGDSPIKKFSLKCVKVDSDGWISFALARDVSDRVGGWISNVLARGVSDLDLSIILVNYRLSPKCFESRNLVKLKITCGISIGWLDENIYLPMLKTLVFDSATFYFKFDILLHALPVLEELVLIDVIWGDSVVTVSSASLKNLTIKDNNCLRYCTLSLDTPGLVYFKYSGYVAKDYPLVNMENLMDARIIFSLTGEQIELAREPDNDWLEDDEDEDALALSNVWKLFHGMRNVPYLYLSPDTFKVLSLCYDTMPVFNNLKSLAIESHECRGWFLLRNFPNLETLVLEVLSLCCESMPVLNNLKVLCIKSDMHRGWQAMPVILSNCPNLETLVLECLLHYDNCGDACDCISREDKGRSLTSCPVKKIQIKGFRGTMEEMNMIKHFLDYCPCLKEMEIFVAEDGPKVLRNAWKVGEGLQNKLPFKFQVLEISLKVVSSFVDSSETEAWLVLNELTKNVSTKNLEYVQSLKSNLTRLLDRVEKVRDEIENLLEDNEDDVDDLEMLVEAYFTQVDGMQNKILTVWEYIDDTEDYVNIQCNEPIQWQPILTSLFETNTFRYSVWTVTAFCIVLFMVFLGYPKWKKLLGS